MNYLSVENVSKSYGEKVLFQEVTFGIEKGQKLAFVAKNGSGKTTLLKIISQLEEPESGSVTIRKGIRVGFLEQSDLLKASISVKDAIYSEGNKKIEAIKSYNHCIDNNLVGEQMEVAFEAMNVHEAWEYEIKIQQIVSQLKLDRIIDVKIEKLSGGQRKRVQLAKVLLDDPDFMVLDEPTNHLDLDMIEWLEHYLEKEQVTLFMVTHDRYFLERVCDEILELDAGRIFRHKGNYSYFLEKKAQREDIEHATVGKARSHMRKELEWIRRQPKARGTKQKARVDSFEKTKEIASQNLSQSVLDLPIKMQRLGTKILELHNLQKSYGDLTILNKFNYNFIRGEKVGIVGHNGSGKSTFLNILTENESLDAGKVVVGETVAFGYYHQEGIKLAEDKRVIEVVKDIAEIIPVEGGKSISASQFLERFLFPSEMHYVYVNKLSGGERKRLYLMTILMKNPNFLILDEPTNDLDIFVLGVLEDFLINFKGCLLVVSHDRYFMDRLVDHMFVFKGDGEVQDIIGNYTKFREVRKAEQLALRKEVQSKKEKKEKVKSAESEKRKLTYNEKKEYDKLEKEIAELESKKDKCTAKLNSGSLSNTEIIEEGTELGKLVESIEEKTLRWMELAELV